MLLLDLLVFFKELVKQGVLAQLLGHPSSWCNSDKRTCRTPKLCEIIVLFVYIRWFEKLFQKNKQDARPQHVILARESRELTRIKESFRTKCFGVRASSHRF